MRSGSGSSSVPPVGSAEVARELAVHLHGQPVGWLSQDEHGDMAFRYGEAWLVAPDARPVSLSLPLRSEPFPHRECRGYFAGILPEGGAREAVARAMGVSPRNDYALLEAIGGECAGAVSLLPPGDEPAGGGSEPRELDDRELAELLRELPRRPLMAGRHGLRLSLAGAQDKLAVVVEEGRIALPNGDSPSTHILKVAIEGLEETLANEAFCLKLAARAGLEAARPTLCEAGGEGYLLVERYDRVRGEDGRVEWLHQEDFCQALGVPPELKYQREGGPGVADCVSLLRRASGLPARDIPRFVDAVILHLLVGNADAHGKNASLLHDPGPTRLAPLYDVMSTACYPELATGMAMKVGGEYDPAGIFGRHFERMAEEAGLGPAIVRRRVPELAGRVLEALRGMEAATSFLQVLAGGVAARCEQHAERCADASGG